MLAGILHNPLRMIKMFLLESLKLISHLELDPSQMWESLFHNNSFISVEIKQLNNSTRRICLQLKNIGKNMVLPIHLKRNVKKKSLKTIWNKKNTMHSEGTYKTKT